MTEYLITENGIVVGVFQNKEDMDKAFEEYFIKSGKFGMKGERWIIQKSLLRNLNIHLY